MGHSKDKDLEAIKAFEEHIETFRKRLVESSALQKQEGGNHYKDFAIQPIEFIYKNNLAFCEGNIIKYVCRHRKKNGIEDLRKAKHYLEILAELEYGMKL